MFAKISRRPNSIKIIEESHVSPYLNNAYTENSMFCSNAIMYMHVLYIEPKTVFAEVRHW